jgi:hypothetical protein
MTEKVLYRNVKEYQRLVYSKCTELAAQLVKSNCDTDRRLIKKVGQIVRKYWDKKSKEKKADKGEGEREEFMELGKKNGDNEFGMVRNRRN